MPDYRFLYADAVAERLGPEERLLALSEARRPAGVAPTPPPEPPKTDGATADRARTGAIRAADVIVSGVDFGAGFGSSTAPFDALRRLIWGRAAYGPLDSSGGSYAAQVPPGRHLVAVTDRRLVIFRTARSSASRPVVAAKLTPLWAVDRSAIVDAKVRRHWFHRSRLRVMFRDGSWLELTGPLALGHKRAEELRQRLVAG